MPTLRTTFAAARVATMRSSTPHASVDAIVRAILLGVSWSASMSCTLGRPETNPAPAIATSHTPFAPHENALDQAAQGVELEAPATSVSGIDFLQLDARTATGDTVAHMELTGLLFLPHLRGLLVWQKSGRISHYSLSSSGLVLIGEFRLDGVYGAGDCGLISVALDPDWEQNGYLYASYCLSQNDSALMRYVFRVGDYANVNRTGAAVATIGEPSAERPWHNLGSIGFFPDAERSMWVLVGDKTVSERAQDLTNSLGAILRIVPGREPTIAGYTPHPDNPFGGLGRSDTVSNPDLYAWGFRSPWRGAVDALGRIWVGDVGDTFEEINLVSKAGGNYGWNALEGPCLGLGCEGVIDPVAYWTHDADHAYRLEDPLAAPVATRVAWVGAAYARGGPDVYEGYLDNSTLIADMCVGYVRAIEVDARGSVRRDQHVGHLVGLSGAAQAPDGYLYTTTFGGCTSDTDGVGSGIFRVVPRKVSAAPALAQPTATRSLADEPLGPMPLKLSATGIFADPQHTQPIARAVAYEPIYPLWSNGSAKERWLLLPVAAQVDNTRRGAWDFPPGTLFFKTFGYPETQSTPVETRVIRRTQNGWDYHAYKWQGDDADLLELERSLPVAVTHKGTSLQHAIPSRFECRSCHESAPSPIIGFDEFRLNAPGLAGSSQLQALHQRGVFLVEPPRHPEAIDHPDLLARAALGYLHGNCAHCHNDSPRSMSKLDLQHGRALQNLINIPTESSGQAAGIRVMPGIPEQSVLFLSLLGDNGTPEIKPMPPIGVQVRDTGAIELIRWWITGLTR